MEICSMSQETETGALCQPRGVGWGGRWEGVSRGRKYMRTCGWFMLRFDRKQQNSVKNYLSIKNKFILFMGFSKQEYWTGLPFPSLVDHILSDLSTMTRPSWWAHMAWLGFIELDKAVVHVIRLTRFLWLWFVCLHSDASHNTDHLTWVSLTLGIGYLFTAAPAKCSHCSLPWMRGISSKPPILILNVE